MKIKSPKVTLADEARIGVEEEVRSGFLDWLFQFSVIGEDGELYGLGGSILSMALEKIDLVTFNYSKGKGKTRQLKNSIYKVGEYPGMALQKFYRNPQGTLKIEKKKHSIIVSCGKEYQVECFDDKRWHITVDSCDGEYKADLWHIPFGFPLWYGRENPSYLTQHSITYGYNWCGDVEGTICIKGKSIKVVGSGIRERYVAVDSSAAELGGWEDWGCFSFNEMQTSMYDMRLGMKDFAVFDIQKNKYYPEGKLEITHEDWVFVREFDGFLPTTYNVKIEVKDGTYYLKAKVCNVTTWGVTFKVPDNPVATLTFDNVEGAFIDKEGNVRKFTDGQGNMSVRQWHAYPNILPRELYEDKECDINPESKFDTL